MSQKSYGSSRAAGMPLAESAQGTLRCTEVAIWKVQTTLLAAPRGLPELLAYAIRLRPSILPDLSISLWDNTSGQIHPTRGHSGSPSCTPPRSAVYIGKMASQQS